MISKELQIVDPVAMVIRVPRKWLRYLKVKAAEDNTSIAKLIRAALNHFYDLEYVTKK